MESEDGDQNMSQNSMYMYVHVRARVYGEHNRDACVMIRHITMDTTSDYHQSFNHPTSSQLKHNYNCQSVLQHNNHIMIIWARLLSALFLVWAEGVGLIGTAMLCE